MRRHRKLLILAAVVVLALGGGVAVAYLIATRPAADVHNGLSDPFTSTPEQTTTAPAVTTTPTQPDWGPPWPMYGREPSHSRDAAELTGIHPPYLMRWQKSGHGVIEYPPSYVDGVLYLASDSGWVAAYRVTNGALIWGRKFVKVLNQPAVYKGRVYFGSYDRRIYSLDAKTGHTVWKKNVGTDMESPPTVAGGRIYMGGLDGTVRALDSDTGRILWTYHTSGPVKGAITLAKGSLYFGDYAGVMYSIRASNGGRIWSTASNGLSSGFRSGQFYSTPNVRYGRVYVGNTDGKLYSFVASSGKIAWTHTIDGWVYGSPATWNGLVFDTGYDGSFEAMDARTGNVKWSVQLPFGTTSSPTVIGNYVYVASHGRTTKRGNLFAFNPRNGHRVWHFNDGWYSTVVNGGTNRLIVAGARNLYMLRSR